MWKKTHPRGKKNEGGGEGGGGREGGRGGGGGGGEKINNSVQVTASRLASVCV